MQRVIILPNGKQCGLTTYVHAWKTIRRMVRDGNGREEIKGFGDWPRPAASILRSIQYGVDDRVNIRGGVILRDCYPMKRLCKRIKAGRMVRKCKWCGQEFKPQLPRQRCCSEQCEMSYRG
jgi:hypothetical protein